MTMPMMRTTTMPSTYQLLFRVIFEHAFFAAGLQRAIRVVPVAACHDMLRRAGVLLRHHDDGVAAFGDEEVLRRLRLHVADAGGPLGMAFQLFFTDPHFHDYTALAWPAGHLLFLDTACCCVDATGRQMLHAEPAIPASAFVDRGDPRLVRILGQRVLAPRPDMVLHVAVSHALIDAPTPAQRHFYARFAATGSAPPAARRSTDIPTQMSMHSG